MNKINRRKFLSGIGAGIGSMAISSLVPSRQVLAADTAATQSSVVFHGHGFYPMMSHVITGAVLELESVSNEILKLISAPSTPEKINLTLAPKDKAHLRFNKPGLYLLYNGITTRFDTKVGQVAARKESRQFPMPAYMVILVTDRHGGGLNPTARRVTIPDSYMTFEPWACVVRANESVTFTNKDMDTHIVMPSPEPMLMPKHKFGEADMEDKLWQQRMNSISPITLNSRGGAGTLTLKQPGLHHYYCPIHVAYSATDYTFYPLKSYGGYPFIMDGVIVVLPT
ncbi:hypothetical protein BJI67_00390 [Acidihalobacter aeolianus]|uniref:Uncharacterized protein n=1 Tax=Acidihalobacter aeolianus TaxID=2792603 RepID=A0A1D8K436_9GAMM|nr:twin-arginine translocation signal domain-containing protein [Acidihalobacter aeolianus]AOV15719.1 hypothetical protein BJI67_00390 [Acidihalobacter aeolianus]